jgi:hypothetical protein
VQAVAKNIVIDGDDVRAAGVSALEVAPVFPDCPGNRKADRAGDVGWWRRLGLAASLSKGRAAKGQLGDEQNRQNQNSGQSTS